MVHKTAMNFLSPVLPFLPCKKAITGMWVKKKNRLMQVQRVMSNACNPILVGVASLVLEIKLAFNIGQILLSNLGLYSHAWGSKNGIKSQESAQKFMQVDMIPKHVHQFWQAWPFWFLEIIISFQKRPNFPFRPWTIVHGNVKI